MQAWEAILCNQHTPPAQMSRRQCAHDTVERGGDVFRCSQRSSRRIDQVPPAVDEVLTSREGHRPLRVIRVRPECGELCQFIAQRSLLAGKRADRMIQEVAAHVANDLCAVSGTVANAVSPINVIVSMRRCPWQHEYLVKVDDGSSRLVHSDPVLTGSRGK